MNTQKNTQRTHGAPTAMAVTRIPMISNGASRNSAAYGGGTTRTWTAGRPAAGSAGGEVVTEQGDGLIPFGITDPDRARGGPDHRGLAEERLAHDRSPAVWSSLAKIADSRLRSSTRAARP